MAKKPDDWRGQIVPRDDFQCSCGCELRLARGDLADAVRLAIPFAGNPRVWGVTYTKFDPPREGKRDADEKVETSLCPGCRYAVVEIPAFAAKLLRDHGAAWPVCAKCMAEGAKPARLRLVP